MDEKKQIHKKIKKRFPHAVKKAKRLFSFDYPKLSLLIIFIFFAYYIFLKPEVSLIIGKLNSFSYLGIFIAGIFLAFGFSAPFSVGFLLNSNPESLILAIIIGGIGTTIGDFLIFKTIKFSFMNEFEKLKKAGLIKEIKKLLTNHILIKHYLLYVFAGIIIVTPLPDEIGVSMLAGLTTIKISKLLLISFILHSIAIFLILYLGIIL